MAEPVSAIATLITTGISLCFTINQLTSSIRDAPKAIQSIRNELFAVNSALCQIQTWCSDDKSRPSKSIQQDIREILSSCLDTFNELEALAEAFKPNAWSKLTWFSKENHALRLLRRIESHKASLNLIVTLVGG